MTDKIWRRTAANLQLQATNAKLNTQKCADALRSGKWLRTNTTRLVIGSGESGKYLSWHLARSGKNVAVIERKLIGGSCPNTNCLPSKNEIWSAKVADLTHHAKAFGSITGAVTTDMRKVVARKRQMVDGLIAMHLDLFKQSGAELIMGEARFVAPKTVRCEVERRRQRGVHRRSRFYQRRYARDPP